VIDPKVENPIDRLPLRPDLFTKAAKLGILNTAGSKLGEYLNSWQFNFKFILFQPGNRQHQLLVKNFSLSTSNWETIADMINTQSISKNYDNPAFQWNNLENNTSEDYCQLDTIFSKLNCSVIYAPCINFKNVLICGTAIEFNFISDVNVDVSLPQVVLFINIFKELDGFKSKIPSRKSTISAEDSFFEKKEEFIETIDLNRSVIRQSSFTDKRSLDDSGFETFSVKKSKERSSFLKKQSSISRMNDSFKAQSQVVPYHITFYSAAFYINWTTPESTIFILIENPNLMISQNSIEKTIIASIFDLKISLDTKN
jgi:vacuolar protein sorting-associated protein 13B